MMTLTTLLRIGRASVLGAVCLWLPVAGARAQQPVVNWPVLTPPAGSNPAVFPVPKNDWMSHFQHSLDRTKKGNVDLVFDGDSITDFYAGTGKEVFAKNYGRLNAANYGISGDRTENMLWRVNNGQVAGLHPKLVVLLIGTNNTGDCSDVQIAEGVTAIVHAYERVCPMATILVQGVFPRSEKPTDPVRAKIKRINAILSKLDDGKKVLYVDFGDKFLQPDGTISRNLMPDALHPNAAGYEVWADAIRPTVTKVFGSVP